MRAFEQLLRFPQAHTAGRTTPRAADRLPVEFSGSAGITEKPEPIHVGPQFSNVAHSVRIRRRRDQRRVASAFRAFETA